MQRRSLLMLGALSPVALFASRYLGARTAKVAVPTDYRALALKLNELAGNIRTRADARALVDFIAEMFSKEVPPMWMSDLLRERIAEAEFSGVSDSGRLIPEARLAEAWNVYVDTVRAPEESKASPAEIHNLRDSFLTIARVAWGSGSRNFWMVPSIYAVGPDGALALGCRPIESIRVLWDLANQPEAIKTARKQVKEGVLTSDLFRATKTDGFGSLVLAGVRVFSNPVEAAERQYIQANGVTAFSNAVLTMLDRTLA